MDPTPGGELAVESSLVPLRRPTREYRATWTFATVAIFTFVVLAFVGNALGVLSGAAVLLGPILGAVVHAIAAAWLAGGSPDARWAMRPLLQILIFVGAVTFVLALLSSTIHIPIGAILGWWSMRAEPDPRLGPIPATSGIGGLLIVGAVLSAIFSLIPAL